MNRSDSCEQRVNRSEPSQVDRPLKGKHLLLVEDEPGQQRLYRYFLQEAGAEVTLECNGKAAVAVVTKSSTRFDVVVTDFNMPEMDGLVATQTLRELGYEGIIIAMSSQETDALKQSWLKAGCNEFIEKPVKKSQLITAIQRHTSVEQEIIET